MDQNPQSDASHLWKKKNPAYLQIKTLLTRHWIAVTSQPSSSIKSQRGLREIPATGTGNLCTAFVQKQSRWELGLECFPSHSSRSNSSRQKRSTDSWAEVTCAEPGTPVRPIGGNASTLSTDGMVPWEMDGASQQHGQSSAKWIQSSGPNLQSNKISKSLYMNF